MFEPTSVPRIKCGQIYIMPNDIFALMCKFCEEDFYNLEAFREHLTEHFSERKPTTIKTEDSVSLDGECGEFTLSELHDMNAILPNHQICHEDFVNHEDAASKSTVVADSEVLTPSILPDKDLRCLDKEPTESEPTAARSQRRHQPKRQCKLYQSIDENEQLQISTPIGLKIGNYMFRKRVHRSDSVAIDLTNEYKKSTDSRNKRNKCRYCRKTFRDKRACSDHENTHTGNRPHKCAVCSKVYFSSSSLNVLGKCRYGACAKTSSSLPLQGNKVYTDDRWHKTLSEGHSSENLSPDSDYPRHKCQYCHRSFMLTGNRERHELMCSENSSI